MPKPVRSDQPKWQGPETKGGGGAVPQADQDVVVTGAIQGKIRDVEVGLITGDVTQTASSGQGASNVVIGGTGASETKAQSASQANTVFVGADADLGIKVDGRMQGQIRDVEVGLITGDVTQTNVAAQAAGNLSVGGDVGSQTVGQAVQQGNFLAAVGDIDITLVFEGDFKGQVRDQVAKNTNNLALIQANFD